MKEIRMSDILTNPMPLEMNDEPFIATNLLNIELAEPNKLFPNGSFLTWINEEAIFPMSKDKRRLLKEAAQALIARLDGI